MKYVVLQGDGMADEPIAELGGKTPLEYARIPNLDHMASRGILGLTRTIPRGFPPGSDVGTMSILGYDPARYHPGRSPIEAASMGVELGPDDVAFRCNLVTLETPEGGAEIMRDFAAGHPPTEEAAEIVRDLGRTLGREGLEFHPGVSYRHLLVWRGGEGGMRTKPPHDLSDKPVAGHFPEGPGADGLRALAERDFLFLHVEAPDEGGHMGDAQKKVEAIENVDAKVVGPLLEGLRAAGGEWRLLVMPDHPTPCALKTHTDDPVPFVVYISSDERKPRGLARGYNERDAREQGIFIPEAHTLLERLLRR